MRNLIDKARRNRYFAAAILANAAIWLIAFLLLVLIPPSFTSEWSVIIPSSDMEAQVQLTDIGQAYATSRSSYDAKSLDPRQNYKAVILSDSVLGRAAAAAGMSRREFGRPKVKLIEQSSVMELTIAGRTAEEANRKARALHDTFAARVSELRADELKQRDIGIEEAIRTSQTKLEAAQKKLVTFKVGSGIVSSKQMEDAVLRINGLQQKRQELQAQHARQRKFVASLSASLALSPELLGNAIALQSDAIFMQHFQRYATGTAELAEARAKWGPNNPQVVGGWMRVESALAALTARARTALDRNITAAQLDKLTIAMADRGQEPLFRELVATQVQASAIGAELAEIERQITASRNELNKLAQEYSQLDDLERRLKFSEAVFNSTIGKTDVGRSHVFSSYPLVQLLVHPTLPDRRDLRVLLFAILGAIAASGFATTALTLAWLRRKKS